MEAGEVVESAPGHRQQERRPAREVVQKAAQYLMDNGYLKGHPGPLRSRTPDDA